ncbi:MAG: DEAD/DEAH box helicase family protein [Mycoplasmatales bacterium]|nr:DEAD/DEAH box helicase family protein [Mycoplasmatales bacterium]
MQIIIKKILNFNNKKWLKFKDKFDAIYLLPKKYIQIDTEEFPLEECVLEIKNSHLLKYDNIFEITSIEKIIHSPNHNEYPWTKYIEYIDKESMTRVQGISIDNDHEDFILAKKAIKRVAWFQTLRNFGYFNFYLANNLNKHLINKNITKEEYSEVDDANLHGRFSRLAQDVSGYRRHENMKNILETFDVVWDVDNKVEKTNTLRQEYEQTVNEEITIWEQTNKEEIIDIFETIDRQQKNIISDVENTLSATINGYAGTGKTVVGYELAGKLHSRNGSSILFLVPNNKLKSKTKDFFKTIGIFGLKVATYEEKSKELSDQLTQHFTSSLKLDDKYKVKMNGIVIPWLLNNILKNHKETVYKVFNNEMDELALGIYLIKHNVLKGEISSRLIKNIYNVIKKEEAVALMETRHQEMYWENEELIKKGSLFAYDQIFLDEAPFLLKFPFLIHYFKKVKHNAIKLYDELQYSEKEVKNLKQIFDYDQKIWILNIVYRTTKEIFQRVMFKSRIEVNTPITIKNSVKIVKDVDRSLPTIKLSRLRKNAIEWIGTEFLELNLIIDKPIVESDKNLIYIAGTRARKYLNIFFLNGDVNDFN